MLYYSYTNIEKALLLNGYQFSCACQEIIAVKPKEQFLLDKGLDLEESLMFLFSSHLFHGLLHVLFHSLGQIGQAILEQVPKSVKHRSDDVMEESQLSSTQSPSTAKMCPPSFSRALCSASFRDMEDKVLGAQWKGKAAGSDFLNLWPTGPQTGRFLYNLLPFLAPTRKQCRAADNWTQKVDPKFQIPGSIGSLNIWNCSSHPSHAAKHNGLARPLKKIGKKVLVFPNSLWKNYYTKGLMTSNTSSSGCCRAQLRILGHSPGWFSRFTTDGPGSINWTASHLEGSRGKPSSQVLPRDGKRSPADHHRSPIGCPG